MAAFLFENPLRLAAVLAAVNVALVWWWRRRPTRNRGLAVLAGLASAAALLTLQWSVVTPREHVQRLCHELADLVQRGDVGGIGEHLTGDFEAAGRNRTDMLAAIENALRRYHPEDARLRAFHFAPTGPQQATMTFDVSCRVVGSDFIEQQVPSRWRLTVRREHGRWRVSRIEALPAPLSPISDLSDVLR